MVDIIPKERRSHVRGDLSFKVKYTIITPEEYEKLKTSEEEIFSPNKEEPIIDITDTDRDTDSTSNTCLIDLLLHMDEKLDRILSILSKGEAEKGFFNYEGIGIDISSSGMNIVVDKPVEPGKIIHANFVLSRFPLVLIDLFGQIIRVTPVDEEGKTMYHLGIKFLDLKPNDREKIITCVFQRQREAIRRGKGERYDSKDG